MHDCSTRTRANYLLEEFRVVVPANFQKRGITFRNPSVAHPSTASERAKRGRMRGEGVREEWSLHGESPCFACPFYSNVIEFELESKTNCFMRLRSRFLSSAYLGTDNMPV